MPRPLTHPVISAIAASALVWTVIDMPAPHAQSRGTVTTLRATESTPDELRRVVDDVRRLERDGAMEVATATDDALLPGHRHERLQQYHLGLRVVGGSIGSSAQPASRASAARANEARDITSTPYPSETGRISGDQIAGAAQYDLAHALLRRPYSVGGVDYYKFSGPLKPGRRRWDGRLRIAARIPRLTAHATLSPIGSASWRAV